MVVGLQNVGFRGGISSTTNAAPYMQAQYQNIATPVDSVQVSKKKGKTAGKVLALGVLVAGALFGLKKTGKLKTIENPTKITEKAQNVLANIAGKITVGVDFVTTKAKGIFDKVKGKFAKAPATTDTATASPILSAYDKPVVKNIGIG